ncbi:MAG: hypothetical protein AB1510_09105 [Bacillota bacterium]
MFNKIENIVIRNIVYVAIILVGGFALFNAAFMLAAIVVNGINLLLRLSSDSQPPTIYSILVFILLLLVASYFVFRSKLDDLIKATFLTMPLMSLLIAIGVSLYEQPKYVPISIGAVIIVALTGYFYIKKMPWMYYFAELYVAALAFFIVLTGIDI